jgi:hypothetical protein
MIRRISLSLAAIVLAAGISSYAAAQGHVSGHAGGPVGASPGGGITNRSIGQPLGSPSFGGSRFGTPSSQRQDETHRLEAQQRRADGEAHNRSAEARAEHAPNEHAADEATLADQNSKNKDKRSERRALKGENRGDHGKK